MSPSGFLQSEKALLYDQVKQDLEDKIRRLEEDRHNIDISSGQTLHISYSQGETHPQNHGP